MKGIVEKQKKDKCRYRKTKAYFTGLIKNGSIRFKHEKTNIIKLKTSREENTN